MATSLITIGGPPFLLNSGAVNAGGKIYFYEAGTSTPRTMYKDKDLTLAHTSPIVLDSYGWPPGNAIWTNAIVDMDIQTSAGVSLRTIDDVNSTVDTSVSFVNENFLINGGFQVAQDGSGPFTAATTPVNSNNTYLFDQWVYLAAAADSCDVSRITTAAYKDPASAYALQFEVATFNTKFGVIQFLDAARTKALFQGGSGIVSLSFTVCAAGGGLTKWKAAVLAWTGTADSPTTDVVSAWGADGVTPTFIANITAENTISTIALTASQQRVEIEGVVLDTAGTTNLAVFLWSDDAVTVAGADFAYLSAVKLEVGYVATDYVERLYSLDYYDALYFHWKLTREATSQAIGTGTCNGTASADVMIQYPVPMRIAPTMTVSANGDFQVKTTNAVAENTTSFSVVASSTYSMNVGFAVGGAPFTVGFGCIVHFDATANGFVRMSARF